MALADVLKNIGEKSLCLFGGYSQDATGYYNSVEANKLPVTLYGHKIQYLFQHQLNEERKSFYAIAKCKLKTHDNDLHWIVFSINEVLDINTVNELSEYEIRILYISKTRICSPVHHPPSFNWKPVIHVHEDIEGSPPIIVKGSEYFGWNRRIHSESEWNKSNAYPESENIKCSETDIGDINIYNAIPIDVENYSTQHSYYKHLPLDGEYHTVIPINGGQRRNRQASPLYQHQIRWHVWTVEWLNQYNGSDIIEDVDDGLWIRQIAIKHKFKFNCFLGGTKHGNWSIAMRKNKNATEYLQRKYPMLSEEFSPRGHRGCSQMIYDEEHEIQIERAIVCARKIYTEIKDVIDNWKKLLLKWSLEYNVPNEIRMQMEPYCNIKLKDWYIDEENNSWRM